MDCLHFTECVNTYYDDPTFLKELRIGSLITWAVAFSSSLFWRDVWVVVGFAAMWQVFLEVTVYISVATGVEWLMWKVIWDPVDPLFQIFVAFLAAIAGYLVGQIYRFPIICGYDKCLPLRLKIKYAIEFIALTWIPYPSVYYVTPAFGNISDVNVVNADTFIFLLVFSMCLTACYAFNYSDVYEIRELWKEDVEFYNMFHFWWIMGVVSITIAVTFQVHYRRYILVASGLLLVLILLANYILLSRGSKIKKNRIEP